MLHLSLDMPLVAALLFDSTARLVPYDDRFEPLEGRALFIFLTNTQLAQGALMDISCPVPMIDGSKWHCFCPVVSTEQWTRIGHCLGQCAQTHARRTTVND